MNSYDPAAPVALHRLAKALVDISGTITGLAMDMADYDQAHGHARPAGPLDMAMWEEDPPLTIRELPVCHDPSATPEEILHDASAVPLELPPLHDTLINLIQFDYVIQRYGVSRVKKAAQVIEQVHELMLTDIFVLADDFLEEREDETPPEP